MPCSPWPDSRSAALQRLSSGPTHTPLTSSFTRSRTSSAAALASRTRAPQIWPMYPQPLVDRAEVPARIWEGCLEEVFSEESAVCRGVLFFFSTALYLIKAGP